MSSVLILPLDVIAADKLPSQTRPTGGIIREFAQRVTLVSATVVGLDENSRDVKVNFRVDHVFCGTGVKAADGFSAWAWGKSRAGDTRGDLIFPVPSIGEVGLWVVRMENGQPTSANIDPAFEFCFPARKDVIVGPTFGRNYYSDALALAQVVEEIGNSSPDREDSVLISNVYAAVPEVSHWTVTALATFDPDGLIKLSRKAATIYKIPLGGQVALDEQLSRVDHDWSTSGERYTMLENWVRNPGSEFESWYIGHRLDLLAQHPNMPDHDLLKYLETLALNTSASIELRRFVTRSVGRILDSKRSDAQLSMVILQEIATKSNDKTVSGQARYEMSDVQP